MTQEIFAEKLSLTMEKTKLSSKECQNLGFKEKEEKGTDYEYDGCTYSLELRNNSNVDLQNLIVECRFYYEVTESWRAKKRENTVTIKHMDKSVKIEKLQAQSEHSAEAGPFVLGSRSIPSGYYYDSGGAEVVESKPKGFWVKVFWTTPGGEKLTADFCEPSSLALKNSW
jgi:hypothetical protein